MTARKRPAAAGLEESELIEHLSWGGCLSCLIDPGIHDHIDDELLARAWPHYRATVLREFTATRSTPVAYGTKFDG